MPPPSTRWRRSGSRPSRSRPRRTCPGSTARSRASWRTSRSWWRLRTLPPAASPGSASSWSRPSGRWCPDRPGVATGKGTRVDALVEAIEVELEAIFQKVLSGHEKVDLQVYLSYADHLRFRQQRDRCLQVIEEALRQPAAARPASLISVMGLHAVAVEMALSKQDDPARFDKAAPHIQALLASTEPRFQGLGHLFQGAIDLEQSGLVRAVSRAGEKNEPMPTPQPKLRARALNHLKQAAAQLPGVAEAQARYGVALVLSEEQNLGRQYLQNALRMGNLEAQYQFWAAWTILQAGYPEEAEPIVDSLFRQLAEGTIPAELEGHAPPDQRRALPGQARARRPGAGREGVREGRGSGTGRRLHGRAPPGPDRGPARASRRSAGAARPAPRGGSRGGRGREPRRADLRGAGQEGRGPQAASRRPRPVPQGRRACRARGRPVTPRTASPPRPIGCSRSSSPAIPTTSP